MKTFIFQTSLSGTVNGYWEISSSFQTEEELKKHFLKFYHAVFNITEITPNNVIGPYEWATDDPNYKNYKDK